jgi:hypothetical protein
MTTDSALISMGDWSAFLERIRTTEKQGARVLQAGQMESEWAKRSSQADFAY